MAELCESQHSTGSKGQKEHYDTHTKSREFGEGDAVWLQNPTAGKLNPKWEGR